MKSKYSTEMLIRELLKETGNLYPLVKAGYIKEEAFIPLSKIARDAYRMEDLRKQRNRAINESMVLLASIEEDFFPSEPLEYKEYIDKKYKEYEIVDNIIAYPAKCELEEHEVPWV